MRKKILSIMLVVSLSFVCSLAISLSANFTYAATSSGNIHAKNTTLEQPDSDHVYFGSYPQTEIVGEASQSGVYGKPWSKATDFIEDSELYAELKSAQWDANNDTTINGSRYHKIAPEEITYSNTGDIYYDWKNTPGDHFFKYEPIKWRVLKLTDNDAFLFCDTILYDHKYHSEYVKVTWETSAIRTWLNDTFYNSAFNSAEKNIIKETNVVNSDNVTYGTDGGNDTVDKVFLLSENEVYGQNAVQYGFADSASTNDSARCMTSSTFAKATGNTTAQSGDWLGNSYWWLRSPGRTVRSAARVQASGAVDSKGLIVYENHEGVCPAIHIQLKSRNPIAVESSFSEMELSECNYIYDGNEKKPEVYIKGLTEGGDYTVSYENCIGPGKATAIATGIGAFEGTIVTEYGIGYELPDAISLSDSTYVYDGKEKTPSVTVGGLTEGTDYTVKYSDNTEAGTASVTVEGINNYVGTKTKTFTISQLDIKDASVTIEDAHFIATGNEIRPVVSIGDLVEGRDFETHYYDNINAGNGSITIIGKGSCKGTVYKTFGIHSLIKTDAIEVTCVNDGNKEYWACSCGKYYSDSSGENEIDEGSWVIESKGHSYSNWTVTKKATCTEDGSKEKVCEVCKDKVEEVIPAAGHIWNEEYTIDKAATCVEDGSKSKHCSVCNAINEDSVEVIPKANHGNCGANGDNVSWSIDDDGLLTISGTGEMTNYEVSGNSSSPWNNIAEINKVVIENGVTKIGEFAFYHASGISEVVIPDSVTSIEKCAFDGCTSLKSIDLPASITTIEPGAFEYSGIEAFIVPSKVTEISNSLFFGGSIKSIQLHAGVTSIGNKAFYNSSLQSIDIPDTVLSIGKDAFCWSSIKSIKLPNTIDKIEDNMFMRCGGLESITIPDSVTSIGYGAFWQCSSLERVIIPDSVTTIGSSAFYQCTKLRKIIIPKNVTSIANSTFWECTNLESAIIPDGVTTIDSTAFGECRKLESITIPESVTTIGDNAFYNCVSMSPVYVVKDSYADNWAGDKYNKEYVYKSGEHYIYETVVRDSTCSQEGELLKTCAACGETNTVTIPKLNHTYGDWKVTEEATCTEDGSKEKVCEICEDKVTEVIPATGHKWNGEYTVDKEASCTEEGSKSIHCSKCDEVTEVTVIPALNHDWDGGKVTTEPTCTKDGATTFTCNRCGNTRTEVIATTGHSFAEEFTIDQEPSCTGAGSKSKHCLNCDETTDVTAIPALGHTFGEWVEITPSTCENEGLRQHTCEVCGTVESENLDPNGHDWEADFTVDLEATCIQDGSQSIHCKNCEAVTDSQVIPATGHSYGDWSTTKEASCTEDGSKEKICSVCGDEVNEAIPALGHAWNESPTIDKAATCTDSGSQSIHCARCDSTKDKETIPALGHDWNSKPTVEKIATCTEDGAESTHCARCDLVKEGSEKAIPKTGHKFSAWKTTKAATEIADGQKVRTCSVCGHAEKQTIAMLKPTLPAVKITTPKAAKKAATIKWKKVSKANQKKIAKIQIQYSLDKSFKSGVKTVTAKKTAASKKITKLKSKKTYYVRIRAYKKSGGAVHVSKWSAVKKVKAK